MSYKRSKFNIIRSVNGKQILYNTYSGHIMEMNDTNIHYMLDSDLVNINSEKMASYLKLGFIVDSDVNEDDIIDELRKKHIVESETLYLYLLPTEECNFRCVYCYEQFKHVWMHKRIQDSIIEYVRQNIKKYKYLRVEWFGGEPLLALDIVEYMSAQLINICRENSVIYYAAMTTNAYTLNLNTFKKLIRCKVRSYQITIDGLRETHDRQRCLANGNGTFERIIKNLIDIKNNVKTNVLDITLRVNISKSILQNIYSVIDYFNETLLVDKRFNLFLKLVGDYGGDRVKNISEQLCDLNDLDDAIAYCKKNGINMYESAPLGIGGNVCYASKNSSWVIGADGKIYKCTVALYDDANHVGNVGENGKFEIFEDKLKLWTGSCKEHGFQCSNCVNSPICLYSICYKRILCGQDTGCQFIDDEIQKHLINYINCKY